MSRREKEEDSIHGSYLRRQTSLCKIEIPIPKIRNHTILGILGIS